MNNIETVTQTELLDLLLESAIVRPVFIWGQPGIGKSSIVRQFSQKLGLHCEPVHGSHIVPEDISGVPEIHDHKTRFCPPEFIAREGAYTLFLDELNGASFEVQKAFYSLILDRKVGGYTLHKDSIIVAAGNRQEDVTGIKPIASALINRMLHVELRVDTKQWINWAYQNNLHELVIKYIETRPDHLLSKPSKIEEPFSTPRSWHMLSDLIKECKELTDKKLKILATGCLRLSHAKSFLAHFKLKDVNYRLKSILSGDEHWPRNPEDRDVLHYLAQAFRADIIKNVDGREKSQVSSDYLHNVKKLIRSLVDVNAEIATMILVENEDQKTFPDWLVTEITRDIPRLISTKK